MLAQVRITSSARFTTRVYHASQRYIQQLRRRPTKDELERRTLAENCAKREGLDYIDDSLEALVVTAVMAMGNPAATEAERAAAIEEAWHAYDTNWDSKIVH